MWRLLGFAWKQLRFALFMVWMSGLLISVLTRVKVALSLVGLLSVIICVVLPGRRVIVVTIVLRMRVVRIVYCDELIL